MIVQDVADPFSPQAQRVLAAAMVVLLLAILELGLALLGAPAVMLIWPVLVVAGAIVLVWRDLQHVRRHGWWKADGESGGSGGGRPEAPDLPSPSGELAARDWERFQRQFWEHVEEQRLASSR